MFNTVNLFKERPVLQDGRVSVSYQPGFLPTPQQVTVHWKCKRSFFYETANVRQVRISSQQASFPAKSSCTYLGNLLVCFPVLHNKGKLIIFPTDLRKSHHNKKKYTQCSKDHMYECHNWKAFCIETYSFFLHY